MESFISLEEKSKECIILEQGSTSILLDTKEGVTIQGEIDGEHYMFHLNPQHLVYCVKLRLDDNS